MSFTPTPFIETINGNTLKEVSQESDFGSLNGDAVPQRVLSANTTYFIRGSVTCANRLLIAVENVAIVGFDREKDGLTYTGTGGDFITVTDVNFEMANIRLSSDNNVGGEVVLRAVNYNASNYNFGRLKVFTLINCQFRNCFDVMYVEGFDLMDIQQTLFWYLTPTTIGCQFKNTSKLQISSCEFVRWFDEQNIIDYDNAVFGDWSSITAYVIGNKVLYNGTFYRAITNNTNREPSTTLGVDWNALNYATTPMVELLANGGGSGFGAINIGSGIYHPQQAQIGIVISNGATIGFGTISSNTGIDVGLTTGTVTSLDYDIQNSTIIQANQGIQNGNAKGILSLTDNIVLLDTSSETPVSGLYSLPVANASFIGGAPTNPITFPIAQRVITSSANGSFTYDSKIDGNFNVNLNATVGVNANGTFDIQVQFRQNGTPLPLIGKTTIRNSGGTFVAQPIGLSIQGTATQGDVFDVLISVASANDVLVSELIVNGYQF
jgi:hypothetical protein